MKAWHIQPASFYCWEYNWESSVIESLQRLAPLLGTRLEMEKIRGDQPDVKVGLVVGAHGASDVSEFLDAPATPGQEGNMLNPQPRLSSHGLDSHGMNPGR